MDPRLIGNYIRFPTAKAVWDAIATTYFDGVDTWQVYDLKRKSLCLDGHDDRLDKIQVDVLQLQPSLPVEQAYAYVRQEDLRQTVMLAKEDNISNMAMISKAGQKPQHQHSLQMMAKGKPKTQVEEGGCTHCGNTKHTKDTCFKLHGYPDWLA
ncbi:hypothetical protein BUALT_Bualt13G0098200 [Buddleja alternifolia]|uniref:Uncharacterized protein n=1 Tax=Buddleja alternifolia TaxID=168488 RepID=A0AAV6WV76_9LAMI|nr:hypothetical protein BUALT_Bualt13G0098200 [Buddleja alternifolia]